MNGRKENYSPSLFFSLILHFIVVSILILSFDFTSRMPVVENAKNQVINATVLTSFEVPKKIIQKTPPKIMPKPKPLPKPVWPIESKPIETKKPVIAISNKVEKKSQQNKMAQQMLAEIKKEVIKQKKIKQKTLAAEFEKDIKQMSVKSLQQDLLQEQKRMQASLSQKARGEVNKYKALILQAISQHWLIPPSVNKNLSAELMIRVAPGGGVLDVVVVKSSGDEGLDHSARSAVFKASPLPVPKDPDAFDVFRQFVLKVKPKDIQNTAVEL